MSTAKDPTPIPVGDIAFYDNDVPVPAGSYRVSVEHTLFEGRQQVNTEGLGASQEIVVCAPQFSLESSEAVSLHPPNASSGRFGEELPHVVLREPALPWERALSGAKDGPAPWLALLVLTEDEILNGQGSPTRAQTSSIEAFLKEDGAILKPRVKREADIDEKTSCNFVELSVQVFEAVVPRLEELRFLAHCRQANLADKATVEQDPNGFFSVVVANRFPARPPKGVPAVKNIVHLVSVEGLEHLLVKAPDFGGHKSVALVSLLSFTFQCLADHDADFRGLVQGLVAPERSKAGIDPDRLWLRLPVPDAPGESAAAKEMVARVKLGFTPLEYHTRTGEQTFAWYRGPLVPVSTQPLVKSGPFLTADAAIAYQPAFGVFDMSLAAAWNAGRSAALSDRVFCQRLLDFRRRAHRFTDQLLHQLQSRYFLSKDQIDSLSTDTRVEDELLSVLSTELVEALGAPMAKLIAPKAPHRAPPQGDPKAAVADFLGTPAVQEKIQHLVKDDLLGVAEWLARLLLLEPLPFNSLVPDERMLPAESLRFFYLDNNWIEAALDGALSLGLESSRQTFFHRMTRDVLHQAAFRAAQAARAHLQGSDPAPKEGGVMSGLLLRSALVSGWPHLAVRPYLPDGKTMLRILRMHHLSPSVLLCLFWGIPSTVELSEPQEGFRFGTDDDGNLTLRNPIAPAKAGDAPVGQQIGKPFSLSKPPEKKPPYTRGAESRVLDLSPGSETGLVRAVEHALAAAAPGPIGRFGPAEFALQMIKAPEAIQFPSRSKP
ncbi:hypothetical protein [Hyalangium versicolor]|uniref:hypothetical protein n=1 Tax=Hyalangium versicolor TaxID=2861190 RepID=UPI001CCC6301|nr:hypothetical protein [Hyalangium versicolor]